MLPSVIGPQPGETGSAVTLTTDEAEAAAERLMAMADDPAAVTDRLEAALRRSCGLRVVSLAVTPAGHDPRDYDRLEVTDPKDLAAVARQAREALVPAPVSALAKELAMLEMTTAQAQRDDIDTEARAQIYLERLLQYPADIALYVVRSWSLTAKFFPTWSEFHRRLELLSRRRMALSRMVLAAAARDR